MQVIDFGSSCFGNKRVYTYIQSRFYRAPEVIIGASYSTAIDMWSFGCILCELLTGHPLFAGEDEADQLACIIEVLGIPPANLLVSGKRTRHFFASNRCPRYCTVNTTADGTVQLIGGRSLRGQYRGAPQTKDLVTDVLRDCNDVAFVDFLRRCLDLDPSTRMRPAQAMRHEWIAAHRRNSQQHTAQHAQDTTKYSALELRRQRMHTTTTAASTASNNNIPFNNNNNDNINNNTNTNNNTASAVSRSKLPQVE